MKAARNVAERSPVQEESIVIPIHYERPTVCLQRERPCTVEVWRKGGGARAGVGVRAAALLSVLLFFTFSPTPHCSLVPSSHLTWGSSSVRGSSSREGRQSGFFGAMALKRRSNCHVADSWEKTSASKEGRRPPQVAKQSASLA